MAENKNNSFEEIWKVLKNSKRILIPLHPKPDGDSLGCSTAMKYILEREGVKVRVINRDELTENLEQGFGFSKEVIICDIEKENIGNYDWILLLDHGYSGYYSEEFISKNKEKIINIDHHKTNDYFGKFNYVEPKSSCCSIVYEICEKMKINIDDELSRRILVGICTDTNFGEYGDSGDNLNKMSELIKIGKINYQKEFVNPIINSNPWKLKKLHGILLTNMEKKNIRGKTVVYSWATKEDYDKYGLSYSDIRLGITCMLDIKNIDLIFTLTETEDGIKGSFRSKGIDTTVYSTVFGGGGHKNASAFILEKGEIKDLIERVLKVIEEKGFFIEE
jgi:phosphoesterase RecJ-like protein